MESGMFIDTQSLFTAPKKPYVCGYPSNITVLLTSKISNWTILMEAKCSPESLGSDLWSLADGKLYELMEYSQLSFYGKQDEVGHDGNNS